MASLGKILEVIGYYINHMFNLVAEDVRNDEQIIKTG